MENDKEIGKTVALAKEIIYSVINVIKYEEDDNRCAAATSMMVVSFLKHIGASKDDAREVIKQAMDHIYGN